MAPASETEPNPDPESEPSAANYIWEGTITDLIELAIAIYNIKLIRKSSGELITYAEIVRVLKIIFGIKIPKNIYSRKARAMERKKNTSPLLERMLALYKNEVEKMYR
ncbi:RteC domain-containing protein [Dysgonomonas sp. GY617]|uniref:RteC domain-containing protein n=1 Tax=Dysgonomonas sp. GY617 TaxID=2780420 RepID=UPI00293C0D2A|nr:RteC domain-containing protein [Dysgonomonas sp. GY617]